MELKYYTITNNETDLPDKLEASLKGRELIRQTWSKDNPVPFTKNFNTILRNHIEKQGFEVAPVILNDDTEFEDIDEYEARTKEKIEKAGIILSMQGSFEHPERIICAGTSKASIFAPWIGGLKSQLKQDEYVPYWSLPFVNPCINPRMVMEIGLLDENMQMYLSDTDYCVRAMWAGFPVLMDRGSVILHHAHATLGNSPNQRLWFTRDFAVFQQKYMGTLYREVQANG